MLGFMPGLNLPLRVSRVALPAHSISRAGRATDWPSFQEVYLATAPGRFAPQYKQVT